MRHKNKNHVIQYCLLCLFTIYPSCYVKSDKDHAVKWSITWYGSGNVCKLNNIRDFNCPSYKVFVTLNFCQAFSTKVFNQHSITTNCFWLELILCWSVPSMAGFYLLTEHWTGKNVAAKNKRKEEEPSYGDRLSFHRVICYSRLHSQIQRSVKKVRQAPAEDCVF